MYSPVLKKLMDVCKKIKSIFKEPSFLTSEELERKVSWALKKVTLVFWKCSEEWQYTRITCLASKLTSLKETTLIYMILVCL